MAANLHNTFLDDLDRRKFCHYEPALDFHKCDVVYGSPYRRFVSTMTTVQIRSTCREQCNLLHLLLDLKRETISDYYENNQWLWDIYDYSLKIVPSQGFPPFRGAGLLQDRVRHKHVSWLLVSKRLSFECWEHICQSLQADNPPSIWAFEMGHSFAFCFQYRFNGSPPGADIQISSNSLQPQYGSIELSQLARDKWRPQCWAGIRIIEFSDPIYSDSVCFKNCMVKIFEFESISGCHISMRHISFVLANIDNFFTKLSSVATYIIWTRWWNFVETESNVICVKRSNFEIYNGCSVIGWIASSINWYTFEPIKSRRVDGSVVNLHSYGSLYFDSFRWTSFGSQADVDFSWCLNGPLNAAFMAVKLNAQMADPWILFLFYNAIKNDHKINPVERDFFKNCKYTCISTYTTMV